MRPVALALLAWAAAPGASFADATTPRAAPRLAPTTLAAPDAGSVADLDAWLARLTGPDADARRAAVAAIDTTPPAAVAAIARRIGELRKTARRDAMSAALAAARKGAPRAHEPKGKQRPKPDDASEGAADAADWLDRLMGAPRPADAAWRDLVAVLGMERALAHVGTTPAVREMVGLFSAFGDLVRVDLQRQIGKLGERAVAALIEARHAGEPRMQAWAARQLETLGKAVPGEAVQTSDHQVLADVLRAYGRAHDLDAARVIVSFASSDRALVRDAARDAVSGLGQAGLWQLRDAYESMVGKKAPDDWAWDRVAGELFAAHDRSRLADVYALFDDALTALRTGDLDAMAKGFDAVLARVPTFERRGEMVTGYEQLARRLLPTDRPRAIALLRRASRLDPSGPRSAAIAAELAYVDAEDLAARGIVDRATYERALTLDPTHAGARAALERLASQAEGRADMRRRWSAAIAIGLLTVLGMVAGWLRLRRRSR